MPAWKRSRPAGGSGRKGRGIVAVFRHDLPVGDDLSATGVSFLIPCLDEAETLPAVLQEIDEALCSDALAGRPVEVLVADNGSTDGSAKIAEAGGARVVFPAQRGYGAALQCGIAAAKHPIVVYADADGSYDFREAPALIAALEAEKADLVVGSRLAGDIRPGAMPWAHRYLGTPVLTTLINLLHRGTNRRLTDCNGGLRAVRAQSFAEWNVKASGMEFASQMLVLALRAGARVTESPVTLRPDLRSRPPHLARWRDGMRHLLVILSHSPRLFFNTGVALFAVSWAILLVALSVAAPIELPGVNLFGVHTMLFGLLGTLLGLNVFGVGTLLAARDPQAAGPYSALVAMDEGKLFWGGAALLLVSFALAVTPILVAWGQGGWRHLALEKQTVALIAFGTNGVFFLFNLIAAHLIKD